MNLELKRRIAEIALECAEAGWDGYGANAVTEAAVATAYDFADAIESSVLIPDVSAEPDGALTFEWHRSALQTLSVSLHAHGILHYAALLGVERICGTEAFQARMPQVLKELITRIERQDSESSSR